MATVQGAFVGIVFSIFVLASQVSASQFTPLTLEQLSRSRGFAALLGFYVFSILTNVYFIQTQPVSGIGSGFSFNLNLPIGIGVGLMTASLFSLLIARQLLAELTAPEHLLERTAQSVSPDSFTKLNTEENPKPTAPSRTSFFTIERILIRAHRNGDEYTVQQAIHQLWKAINKLLTPSGIFGTDLKRKNIEEHIKSLDVNEILQYWSTSVEYGSKGPLNRIHNTTIAHRHILIKLVKANEVPKAIEQFEHLHELAVAAFERDDYEFTLSEYDRIANEIVDHESSAPLNEIIHHHVRFVDRQIGQVEDNSEDEFGEKIGMYFTAVLCNHILFLEHIWQSELSDTAKRSRTDLVIGQLVSNLEIIFDTYDSQSNPGPHKQALLTELHSQLIDAALSIDCEAIQPTERYIVMVAELSLALDREPDTIAKSLYKSFNEHDHLREAFDKQLKEISSENTYRPELKPLTEEQEAVPCFLENVSEEFSELVDCRSSAGDY